MPGLLCAVAFAAVTMISQDDPSYDYSLMADSGDPAHGLSGVDAFVGINQSGQLGFTATESAGGEAGFIATDPGVFAPATFVSTSRSFLGAALNDSGNLSCREQLSGLRFMARRWTSASDWEVVGRGPDHFDSCQLYLDLNDAGLVVLSTKTQGSTRSALMAGYDEPPVLLVDHLSSAKIRPEVSEDGHIVYVDDLDQVRVVSYPSGTGVTVASAASGTQPGISADADAVAYLAGSGGLQTVWLSAKHGSFFHFAVADLADFDSFTDMRVGVSHERLGPDRRRAAVVFAGTRSGEFGAWLSDVDLLEVGGTLHATVSDPIPVATVGQTLGDRIVTALRLHHPLNRAGQVALWMSFDDGSSAAVRADPRLRLLFASAETEDEFLPAAADSTGDSIAGLDEFRFLVGRNADGTERTIRLQLQSPRPAVALVENEADPGESHFGPFVDGEFEFVPSSSARPDPYVNKPERSPPVRYSVRILDLATNEDLLDEPVVIGQDLVDRLRQEYVDMALRYDDDQDDYTGDAPAREDVRSPTMSDSRHFQPVQLAGPDRRRIDNRYVDPETGIGLVWVRPDGEDFLQLADAIADEWIGFGLDATDLIVNSAHRCPSHNGRAGSKEYDSDHVFARAIDIAPRSPGSAASPGRGLRMLALYLSALTPAESVLLEDGPRQLLPKNWVPPVVSVVVEVGGDPGRRVRLIDLDGDGIAESLQPLAGAPPRQGETASHGGRTLVFVGASGAASLAQPPASGWRLVWNGRRDVAEQFRVASHVHADEN